MKRQWWEIGAAADPFQFCLAQCPRFLHASRTRPLVNGHIQTKSQGPHDSPLQAELQYGQGDAPDVPSSELTSPASSRTVVFAPLQVVKEEQAVDITHHEQPSDLTCEPTDNFGLDPASLNTLSQALAVETRFVPCETLAYTFLCKHRRGIQISTSDLCELWEAMPSCLKYTDPSNPQGKYVVFGANPRKHDHVTTATYQVPHIAQVLATFVKQTHPSFEFSTFSIRANMTTWHARFVVSG